MVYKAKINGREVIGRREILMALLKVPEAIVYSSYRTEAEQKILVANGKSETLYSNHRRGLAVDVHNWESGEKKLNEAGLINDISWDKNHFSLGGESQAANYPIIDNPKIGEFFPNEFKINFLLADIPYKEKVIKSICRTASFYSEHYFDLDWKIIQTAIYKNFIQYDGMRYIDWNFLKPFGKDNDITVYIYDGGEEVGLINNTGKFQGQAIIQMPVRDYFFGVFHYYLIHELCHALNWQITKDLRKDNLDAIIKALGYAGFDEEKKLKAVGNELDKLYRLYMWEKLEGWRRWLVDLKVKLGLK